MKLKNLIIFICLGFTLIACNKQKSPEVCIDAKTGTLHIKNKDYYFDQIVITTIYTKLIDEKSFYSISVPHSSNIKLDNIIFDKKFNYTEELTNARNIDISVRIRNKDSESLGFVCYFKTDSINPKTTIKLTFNSQ